MKRKMRFVITGALIVALTLVIAPLSVIAAAGGAEHGIPPGPGEENWKAYPAGMGYIDFEDKSDGYILGEEIPGVEFTSTDDKDWIVGAWSAGGYNGKYPSGGGYTSEGDKWAWLGTTQGRGIITFTEGTAGYFAILTSVNLETLIIEAYDENDNLIVSSGWSSINFNTGTIDRLWVSSDDEDIKYVIIHDTGNYFVVDCVVTDAPGVPRQNEPPVADAGSPQSGEQTSSAGRDFTLDGSGSYDPDEDPITYAWTWDGESATGVNPTVTLPLGTTTVTLVVNDGTEDSAPDTVDITVQDTTAPEVSCIESVNPHGKTVPPAGKSTLPGNKGGQNEDGFYQLTATDICDPEPEIFVSGFGPFKSGDVVKITQAPGATPSSKKMGSSKGQAGAVVAHITLSSDPVITAVDDSGNFATTTCLVPPPPK